MQPPVNRDFAALAVSLLAMHEQRGPLAALPGLGDKNMLPGSVEASSERARADTGSTICVVDLCFISMQHSIPTSAEDS